MKRKRRGPKPRTAANSRQAADRGTDWGIVAAISDLTPAARAEYDRLMAILEQQGNRDRTDPSAVVSLARITDLLDRAHAEMGSEELVITAGNGSLTNNPLISIINSLTMRRRALLNDLGLTPASNKVSRSVSAAPQSQDPVAKHLKIHG